MTTTTRNAIAIIAVLAALAAGYGLALITTGSPGSIDSANHDATDAHAADDGHADQHAGESGGNHDDDDVDHDDHGDDDAGAVRLTPLQIASSGIEVVGVGRGGGSETRVSGRVEPAIDARAAVAAAIGGRVERVHVASGAVVAAGEVLATIVSGDAAALRASAEAARADAEAARLGYLRDQSLVTQGVVARQELEASRARSLAADASARAASAQVSAAGSPDAAGRVTITSPMSGVVGTIRITPGSVVAAGDLVANVSDPARTELVFTAPPALASQVAAGTRIDVSGPGGNFAAIVLGSAADVHEQGGAAIIRARADGASLPPAGSPVAGVIVTKREDDALTVPADALQSVEGRSVVFVADERGFRATPVLAGRRAGGRIEILTGLSGDERIAATNAFLLKADLAKSDAGHGH